MAIAHLLVLILTIRSTMENGVVKAITSGPREGGREAKRTCIGSTTRSLFTAGTEANNEIDTRADTSCLGPNWRPIAYTGQKCTVKGFLDALGEVQSIPIATCALAWDHPSNNKTYIPTIHKGLYFGSQLDHSLINPNQLRHNNVEVYDNAFDDERPFSILTDGITIPFDSQGATIFFKTRVPTDDKLRNCTPIHLTSEQSWDPHTVRLPN